MSRRHVRMILSVVTTAALLALSAPAAGAAAWTWAPPVNVSPTGLSRLACAGTALCVAADSSGHLIAAPHPSVASPAWTAVADVTTLVGDIDCPSATLCVATAGDSVLVSTEPLVSGSWVATQVDAGHSLYDLDCAATSLCAATDDAGNVITSSAPTSPSGWAVKNLTGIPDPDCGYPHQDACPPILVGIACPSAQLCLAPDGASRLWISSDPVAGTWRSEQFSNSLQAVACPSAGECELSTGNPIGVLTSHDPSSGVASWSSHAFTISPVMADVPITLACPTRTVCVAWNGYDRRTWVSGGPTAPTLTAGPVDPYHNVTGVACPTAASCLVSDDAGNIVIGTPGSAPVAVRGPRISGRATVGRRLRGNRGRWRGSTPIGYLYQWQRCRRTCVDVAGATGLRYRLRAGDEGARMRLVVTADNILGRVRRTSPRTARVVPAPPAGRRTRVTVRS